MREITEMIAQALVDRPQSVKVESLEGKSASILRLSVGRGDTGKIIGKNGRTADALRTILKAIAAKEKRRVVLEIEDESHAFPLSERKSRLEALPRKEREDTFALSKRNPSGQVRRLRSDIS